MRLLCPTRASGTTTALRAFLHWIAQAPTRVAFCSPEEPCAVTNLNKGTRTCRRVDKSSYTAKQKRQAEKSNSERRRQEVGVRARHRRRLRSFRRQKRWPSLSQLPRCKAVAFHKNANSNTQTSRCIDGQRFIETRRTTRHPTPVHGRRCPCACPNRRVIFLVMVADFQ